MKIERETLRLYAVTDRSWLKEGESLCSVVEELLKAGVTCVQPVSYTHLDVYKRQKELGLNEEDYGFYLDLRKYGSARHSGFGLGFERCVMYRCV